MKKIFALLSLFVSGIVSAQYQISTMVVAGMNPTTRNVVEWSPTGAGPTTKTIIFTPGAGESGTDVNALFVWGPATFMRDGSLRPTNIRIICVQPERSDMTGAQYANIVTSVKARYGIGTYKVYLTGLSYGALSIFNYLKDIPTAKDNVAGIVPFSFGYNGAPITTYANIRVWALCGNNDAGRDASLQSWVNSLIAATYPAKYTEYTCSPPHGCWNTYYNPSFTEAGQNIYVYMTTADNSPASPALCKNEFIKTEVVKIK